MVGSGENHRMTVEAPQVAPAPPRVDRLPPFAVVLHNDDTNEMVFVVRSIAEIARVPLERAFECMMEAHEEGQAIVLQTHREHAELLCESFQSKGLVASVERAA
jgi:ATP-dependent Clp protease adaptor protein ClpS